MKQGFSQHRYRILHWSFAAAMIILSLVGGSLTASGAAEITGNTVWTAAQSPYLLQSDLIIKPGAILTIEPGVEVRMAKINIDEGSSNRAEIIVLGKLLALGTIDQPIRFTADAGFEEMGDWSGIYLGGSGSRLEYVQIDRALTGVTVTGQAEIKWSRIEKNLETGILVEETGSPTLIGNEFTYNRVGLFLGGSAVVQENRFQSNSYGLLGAEVGNLTLTGNSFESNTYGIYLERGEPGSVILENLIALNDYGIYIDGGVPPRVNYNDLYNNRMYDFYHLAQSDVDAGSNWWGTTSTAIIDAYIYDQHDNSGPVTYGYVDYTGFLQASALAPTIVKMTLNPPALRSGTLTATITFSKEMSTQVKPQITYGLFEPYTTHTVSQGQWLSLTEYRFTLNVGETMPEGMYRFKVSGAQSIDGQALKANITYTFLVDRTAPQIYADADFYTFSPNGDGKQDSLNAELYFDEPAVLTYGVYQGAAAVWGPEAEAAYVQQKSIQWDGRSSTGTVLAGGEYELRITVRDQAGNQSLAPEVIPVIIDVTAPGLQVNPVSGIQTGTVVLTGQVEDRSTPLTTFSYRRAGAEDWVRVGQIEGNLIGTLYSWDTAGLLDGHYEVKVEASDLAGNTTGVIINLEVDVNAPQVALTMPAPDAHLAGEVEFSGRAADYRLNGWKLELEVAGVWVELAAGVEAYEGLLARLDISTYPDGEHRVRLTATDLVGRTGQLVQKFQVDNATPPEIRASNIGPAYISPDGDGFADRLRFLLTFSEIVLWEIGLKNNTGETICTLTGEGQQVESYWDGQQTGGGYAGDGAYTYTLTYSDQVGHPGTVLTGQVRADTVPPVLEVSPLPVVTNKTALTVNGQAAGFSQVLINGKKVVVDGGAFRSDLALLEGVNTVSVIAEDEALNRAVQTFTIQCDTVLPMIELDPLKALTNRPEVAVSGKIVESDLTGASVRVLNQLGEKLTVLTVTPEEQKFAVTLPLAVGTNELIFEALDAAGNRGEKRAVVEYLPTIPEIYLLEPAGPYLPGTAARVVLKVLEGSIPLNPASIRVELDGVPQVHEWLASSQQVGVQLTGLTEREYLLTAEAANTQGEAGGGLQVALVVDLTNPVLTLTTPLPGEVLDGWDGTAPVAGSAADRNLKQLTITLRPAAGGAERVLTKLDLAGETGRSGEFAVWPVQEWANGKYVLEAVLEDMAGREAKVERSVEVYNTGMVSGRVEGDLTKIIEPLLYLVQGKEIRTELSFDLLTGDFAERVPAGRYDLVLMPWGYQPVVLPGLQIKVGQTTGGLALRFNGEVRWNLASGKQLIAVPFIQTGAPGGAAGKIITFQGFDGKDYYALKDWTLQKPGRGYWVNQSETLGLILNGIPAVRQEYRLPLTAGWNLIGTPYNYPYPLAGLQFKLDGQTYSFDTARQTGKVDAGIWHYQNWYRQSSVLEPWSGYWMYVSAAGEVIFRPELADVPYKWPEGQMQMLSAAPDVMQAPEWQVQIRASVGEAADVENYFGTQRGTRSGFDPGVDLREPPGFTPYVALYFSETGAEQLTSAYQPPVAGVRGERTWQMTVESGQTGWVELKWNLNPESIFQLLLTDEAAGTQVDMFAEATYRFYQAAGEKREFTLTALKGDFEIKRLYNYANPFAAKGPGKTGTRIRYLLTADAEVEVTVMDVVGRVVKRFPVMQAGKPGGQEGWNEIYWDGRNGKGEPAANGAYILKVKACYGKKYYTKNTTMAIINGR